MNITRFLLLLAVAGSMCGQKVNLDTQTSGRNIYWDNTNKRFLIGWDGSFGAATGKKLDIKETGPLWQSYTGFYNSAQVNIGGYSYTSLFGRNAVPSTTAVIGMVSVPSTGVSTNNGGATGIAGYVNTQSAINNAVGVFGFGGANTTGASAWGMNSVTSNCDAPQCPPSLGNTGNTLYGYEADFNFVSHKATATVSTVAPVGGAGTLLRVTTSGAHGFTTGEKVDIRGVSSTLSPAPLGQFDVTVLNTTQFTLNGTSYVSGAYTSGGTVRSRPVALLLGLDVIGDSNVTPYGADSAKAINVDSYGISQVPHLKWDCILCSQDGAGRTAVDVGTAETGNNTGSQLVVLRSRDSGGTAKAAILQADPNGAVSFSAPQISLLDNTGQPQISIIGGLGSRIGPNGSWMTGIFGGSAAWDPANLADGASTSTTITATGCTVGMPAFAGLSSIGANSVAISAVIQAADTIRVVITNRTGGALDIASGTARVACIGI